ncbi:MAG: protein TolR [Desulfobulbaceae bacterium]|nr:protein TolR [Desulfobulbaceae bacterium]
MGTRNGGGHRGVMAEINVTPLVDVMLVLLIIFMVTAPMMTQGLEVNLPETTTKALRQKEEPLMISMDKDGNIKLGNVSASPQYLWEQLNGMSEEEKKNPIFLRADKDVPYGKVVVLMADIKRAGFEKLGMLTQPEDSKR